jgi:hypothetical protein
MSVEKLFWFRRWTIDDGRRGYRLSSIVHRLQNQQWTSEELY